MLSDKTSSVKCEGFAYSFLSLKWRGQRRLWKAIQKTELQNSQLVIAGSGLVPILKVLQFSLSSILYIYYRLWRCLSNDVIYHQQKN